MLNWSPNVSSSLHKPSLVFHRGCRFPWMGKEQKGRRGEERLCWPCCLCERSCFVLRGQLSSPFFSYILAATFFTPLCELLPDYLCERETCLSWWCICSCFSPGAAAASHAPQDPLRCRGPPACAEHGARAWTAHPLGVTGVLRITGATDGRRDPSWTWEGSMVPLWCGHMRAVDTPHVKRLLSLHLNYCWCFLITSKTNICQKSIRHTSPFFLFGGKIWTTLLIALLSTNHFQMRTPKTGLVHSMAQEMFQTCHESAVLTLDLVGQGTSHGTWDRDCSTF